jgi:hypothetical protein
MLQLISARVPVRYLWRFDARVSLRRFRGKIQQTAPVYLELIAAYFLAGMRAIYDRPFETDYTT